MNYDKLIRQIRNSPLLFDSEDDHKIHRILGKALEMRSKRVYAKEPKRVGQYSGMTKQELSLTGTCETDWY
jgi:hypothetical protein